MHTEIQVPSVLEAVKQVGDTFLKEFKQAPIPQNKTDFYTQFDAIDQRCMSLLNASIGNQYPNIPWMGSEFDFEEQKQPLDLDEYWICDSMDGAIQYIQHLPGWTINLALIRQGKIHFSVIYDALANELFWAKADQGAYMNDNRLQSSRKTELKDMLAVFEYTHHNNDSGQIYRKIGHSVGDLLSHFGVLRNYGPHGLQLAYVGAGRIDLFHQEDLDTYNWLAGVLIAKEAGAEILTTDGSPWSYGKGSLMVGSPGVGPLFLTAKTTTI